jgi:hypothetical protein
MKSSSNAPVPTPGVDHRVKLNQETLFSPFEVASADLGRYLTFHPCALEAVGGIVIPLPG